MRQDSVYWILYNILKSDLNYYLISYSYYAKFALSRDKIFFQHINVNLTKLINHNQEENIIQEIVSLDNENMEDCTQILSGMHRYLQKWWERIHKWELNINSFMHRITNHMYNNSNKKFFSIDWTNILCKQEIACIILSHLSHDLHESTKKT